jgi:hypothetical protein
VAIFCLQIETDYMWWDSRKSGTELKPALLFETVNTKTAGEPALTGK